MTQKAIKQYNTLRNVSINRIRELYQFAEMVRKSKNRFDHVQFKTRVESVSGIVNEFEKNHSKLLEVLANVEEADFSEEDGVRSDFDSKVIFIRSVFVELFGDDSQRSKISGNLNKISGNLPKITLPTFDGNWKSWPSFRDLYESLVHNQACLDNIEKFQYLILSLSGEPLSLVKSLPLEATNYPIAYETLKKRYQNRRLLATFYFSAISRLPKISIESSHLLRQVLDGFAENLSALKNLGLPVDDWDFVLFNMLSQKIDTALIKRFEMQYDTQDINNDIPTFLELVEFLEKQCCALDTVAFTHPEKSVKRNISPNRRRLTSSFLVEENNQLNHKQNNQTCAICKKLHGIFQCELFNKKSPKERYEMARQKRLCLNCLGNFHKSIDCRSEMRCKVCKMSHHTLLHFKRENVSEAVPHLTAENKSNSIEQNLQVSLTNTVVTDHMVLLSTALVDILDGFGNYQTIRVLLDSGSQVNVITAKCRQKLGLSISNVSLSISGLGKTGSNSSGLTSCSIRPVKCSLPQFDLQAVILPRICADMPSAYINSKSWSYLSNLKLADPTFDTPGPVDMLLNADVFSKCLLEGRIVGGANEPVALNTTFGWILSGRIDSKIQMPLQSFLTVNVLESLDSTLKKFWELEELPQANSLSPEEVKCENIFKNTVSRSCEGRYTVSLPFKTLNPTYANSRSVAVRRFFGLERRLQCDDELRENYSAFMQDYLDSGHMSPAQPLVDPDRSYFIPHHCILKPDSATTKLRVVFDASAKAADGLSLNDSLFVGPKLQKDIVSILLSFRLHKFVLTADIKQMYRQISLAHNQRDYQRILWRFSLKDPIQEFCLNTVTYGVASSPYLALRTLQQLADDEEKNFPEACEVLRSDIFMDDLVFGCNSFEQIGKLQKDLIALLLKGCFELRKWASNEPRLLESISKENRIASLSFDQDSCYIKILGLQWDPSLDCFSYIINPVDHNCTKRSMLSDLARIYDPIGYLSPVIFAAKNLIKHLWTLGLDWDEQPPEDVIQFWTKFKVELPLLSSVKIKRRLGFDSYKDCQIHGFCDASMKGYAACVYARFSLGENHETFLIIGKSKVAPLKVVSLPRLELCAAVLLADLISFVVKTYEDRLNFTKVYAWSDSMVALSWIHSSPHRWKTFVSNRVARIQEKVSPSLWYHVPGEENPADCASRGLLPADFMNHSMWWVGPPWLNQNQKYWPLVDNKTLQILSNDEVSTAEEKAVVLVASTDSHILDRLLDKFSSLEKIKRILSYCLRTRSTLKSSSLNFLDLNISKSEMENALIIVIKHVQGVCFGDDIQKLSKSRLISKPLRKLAVFLDERGLLRVGGRLKHADLTFEQKYPILLPSKHRLTDLLIESFHNQYLHSGLQALQFLLLQQFWILSAKHAIRRCLHKCFRCFRVNPKPIQPYMGNLPSYRINQVKAFSCVGVDMAGSFPIIMSRVRGAKVLKAYFCIFVCFATKAIHLEPVSDLSTDSFLASLKRFIGRRGQVSHIFSDCGTNFVGANRVILDYIKSAVDHEKIKWSFNPPSAPHFGGLWEAGVKSVKKHIIRVIGDQILTFEEFGTLLVQIEAVLNSRPLCSVSSDPNDLSVLTPGHFLTLSPLSILPEPDITDIKLSRLNRWQLIEQMHQHFWKRWHTEYLSSLQQRQKWLNNSQISVSKDALVVIKNELCPPLKWRLGRILELYPGTDGICRVAKVKTATGVVQRPLTKLCPLPNQ